MRKFALLLVAAPLVLAACGGSHQGATHVDPLAYVKDSAQKTADLPSEHMLLAGTVSAGGPMMNVAMHGSGDFATATKRGQMALGLNFAGRSIGQSESCSCWGSGREGGSPRRPRAEPGVQISRTWAPQNKPSRTGSWARPT